MTTNVTLTTQGELTTLVLTGGEPGRAFRLVVMRARC
jgi:hypothetical protein